uniref:FinTRIM family, member 99 n=1 Tax=Sinocyclocheilus rhinocerous TaxID=307959 RepID=A0A673N722_9TELE
MAESDYLEYTCPLCTDTQRDHVTVPCGDTFCLECIKIYWDHSDHLGNPEPRPPRRELTPFPYFKRDALCDFCTGRRNKAVKSCLMCLAYYCETHIKPHYESATFKRHKLVDEMGHLDRKICPQHEKGLELFCRSDQMCICVLCTVREHRSHNIVSADDERTEKQKVLVATQTEVQHIIQDRMKELQELRHNVDVLKGNAQRAQTDSDKIFSEMLQAVERWHAEISQLIQANPQASMTQVHPHFDLEGLDCMALVTPTSWVQFPERAIAYKSISRKGKNSNILLGYNDKSWSLLCSDSGYSAWHNKMDKDLPGAARASWIGVYLDYARGSVSFHSVSETMELIHRFQAKFSEPLYAGFGIGSSVTLCILEKNYRTYH